MRLTDAALEAFLDPFTPAAREMAGSTRRLVFDVFPDAIETAEGRELGYGFDRGYKGLVFTISLKKNGVNLGVFGVASLEDPDGLLRGTGKVHRHIEIVGPVDEARVRALLCRALERRAGESPAPPPRNK